MIKKIKTNLVSKDQRGEIIKILEQDKYQLRAILYLTMNKGSVRANHYHKTDIHYVYCLKGTIKYFEKGLSKGAKLESVTLKPGDFVLTPPNKIHAMKALEKSIFLAFTTEGRKQKEYENDLVRIPIVE